MSPVAILALFMAFPQDRTVECVMATVPAWHHIVWVRWQLYPLWIQILPCPVDLCCAVLCFLKSPTEPILPPPDLDGHWESGPTEEARVGLTQSDGVLIARDNSYL